MVALAVTLTAHSCAESDPSPSDRKLPGQSLPEQVPLWVITCRLETSGFLPSKPVGRCTLSTGLHDAGTKQLQCERECDARPQYSHGQMHFSLKYGA